MFPFLWPKKWSLQVLKTRLWSILLGSQGSEDSFGYNILRGKSLNQLVKELKIGMGGLQGMLYNFHKLKGPRQGGG